MAFTDPWDVTTPDGASHRGFQVDDFIREFKRAVEERMEGDPADIDLTGLYDDFGGVAKPKEGIARTFFAAEADVGTKPLEDGRLFVSTDTGRLFHLAAAGALIIAPGKPHYCRISSNADQTFTTGIDELLDFQVEDFDEGGLVDLGANDSRITIPANGNGFYIFLAGGEWKSDPTGIRRLRFRKNGATTPGRVKEDAAGGGQTHIQQVFWPDVTADGDFYEVEGLQGSGGDLDLVATSAYFAAVKII